MIDYLPFTMCYVLCAIRSMLRLMIFLILCSMLHQISQLRITFHYSHSPYAICYKQFVCLPDLISDSITYCIKGQPVTDIWARKVKTASSERSPRFVNLRSKLERYAAAETRFLGLPPKSPYSLGVLTEVLYRPTAPALVTQRHGYPLPCFRSFSP